MKLTAAKLGASSKQLKFLGVLGAILIGVIVYNYTTSTTAVPVKTSAPFGATPAALKPMPAVPVSLPANARRQSVRDQDFRPSLKLKEGIDITKIDPTLRLELLAKLKSAEMKGGTRSVFAFGSAPPPPAADINPGLMANNGRGPAAVVIGPQLPPPPPPPPGPAPPAPIPLKFYGYATRAGIKRAFFLDGDEIQVAGENETIKSRYKVIRIGINSVVVEDTQNQHQQTLPLTEEMTG